MSADASKVLEIWSLNEHVAHIVEDVDEEVCVSLIKLFLLYTLRSPDEIDAGLGFLDSKKDVVNVRLQLGYTGSEVDFERNPIVQIYQNVRKHH